MKIDLSYKERSHWIEFLIGLVALVYFYLKVKQLPGAFNADIDSVLWLIGKMTLFTIIAMIVFTAINRSLAGEKVVESDERDDRISLLAYRSAYHFACSLLFVTVITALYYERIDRGELEGEPMNMINVLCNSAVIIGWGSWLIESVTRLYYYRKGSF